MTSDAYSQGSGLASSSSYIISLIKCISIFNDLQMTDIEICELAYQLEVGNESILWISRSLWMWYWWI
jgi:D-glycero-alpha-D-manno-heptose-7-phosphate kinase